ncbi:unnamed protein product [Peniophora sp. CBMAI 1063]|nr:unnamed protein product [Peniophora sp. CBMAI 1063]
MTERTLPAFDELPSYNGLPSCAWEVWGAEDRLGTVNLLTDSVVLRAAEEGIRTGKRVTLDLPLQFFPRPLHGRMPTDHHAFNKPSGRKDDELHLNTQASSQWDGLLHFSTRKREDADASVLYQGIPEASLPVGPLPRRVEDMHPGLLKLGIHNWAKHGICGRGVLLDMVRFYEARDEGKLPYTPCNTSEAISAVDLRACAQAQGVKFRTGDILLVRTGYLRAYKRASVEEREALCIQSANYVGLEASDDVKRFLWDTHFAAIASDTPSVEVISASTLRHMIPHAEVPLQQRPTPEVYRSLHETLLPLWGMPIGELFDLDAVSEVCAETSRWTFFFASWPLNVIGGVASTPNAAAIF